MTIADQVRTLIAQHLGIDRDRVTDDARFRDDLGADSLDAFELLMGLGGDVRPRDPRRRGGPDAARQ